MLRGRVALVTVPFVPARDYEYVCHGAIAILDVDLVKRPLRDAT